MKKCTNKIMFSHPTGNQNSRHVVTSLQREGLLNKFHTSVSIFDRDIYDYLARIKFFSALKRRKFDVSLKPYTHSHPYKELARMIALRFGLYRLVSHEKGKYCIDAVYHYLDEKVAKTVQNNSLRGVYAYEDGALKSFKVARNNNVVSMYDLPIGYWRTARKLLKVETEKQPEWAMTIAGFKDSSAKLQRKDEELALADHIFVASQFTANSLKDYPGELAPIHVIPYGFPSVEKTRAYNFHITNRALKVLFIGGLSQRKGIAYLFKAVEALGKKIELTIVGKKNGSDCIALDNALAKHRWIPSLPHSKILELMRTQDVFLFPSLFEGFGLVITEAMSQGTPVITTNRTAGPDIITNGIDGWLIEAGSTSAIQNKLEEILLNPISIAEVGRAAMEKAKQRPWSVYGKETADKIRAIIKCN